jgi:heat shock protein HslJ
MRTPRIESALLALVALAALLPAACHKEPTEAPERDGSVLRFRCEDGSVVLFQVIPGEPGAAHVTRGNANWTLPQVASGSGAKYEGEGVLFWTKGSEGTFEQGGTSTLCKLEEGAVAKAALGLTGSAWKLVALGAKPVVVANPAQYPRMLFDAKSRRASGSGGCNRFSGPYELAGESLRFGALASTRMACAQGMDTESAFFAALGRSASYRIVNGQLELLDAQGGSLAGFEPGAPEP